MSSQLVNGEWKSKNFWKKKWLKLEWAKSEWPKSEWAKSEFPQIAASSMEPILGDSLLVQCKKRSPEGHWMFWKWYSWSDHKVGGSLLPHRVKKVSKVCVFACVLYVCMCTSFVHGCVCVLEYILMCAHVCVCVLGTVPACVCVFVSKFTRVWVLSSLCVKHSAPVSRKRSVPPLGPLRTRG